jgi:glycine/D-amino acid oxidase-like deaminating enzyme
MEYDFLLVGQGICGTLLSRQLLQAGHSVLVADNGNPAAAGRVAGGIINPVTGKRMVRSWLAEQLIPFALTEYQTIGAELGVDLVKQCSILELHATREAAALFEDKCATEREYLEPLSDDTSWQAYFMYNYGVGAVRQCLIADLRALVTGWRRVLQAGGNLLTANIDAADIERDEQWVYWKDVKARKLIFCDGAAGAGNRWFGMLPWSKDKGEALIVSIPGLPRQDIYKQGVSIVPWHDGLFWVGAAHDWKYTTEQPTAAFRNSVQEQLDYWLKLPYEVVDHIAALRPANFDRKPFVGMHPVHDNIGIFNGMGGKGCSLAPYFAQQFAAFLTDGTPVMEDVAVGRYRKVLSR